MLLYAVLLSPSPLTPATLAELLALLELLTARARAVGAGVSHALTQQLTSCLLAVLSALSLGGGVPGAPSRAPSAMAALLRSPELAEPLQRGVCLLAASLLLLLVVVVVAAGALRGLAGACIFILEHK